MDRKPLRRKKLSLSKEEYRKIYYSDYHTLLKKGITFKFSTTKDGWYKLYYKDNKFLGYRYQDVIYKKPILVDTFRKEGYGDLIKALEKFISFNSMKYLIKDHAPVDLCQLQSKIILEKVQLFKPERGNKIHTFMCRCINNEIVNESRKTRTLSRAPRVVGDKETFAKIYSLDDEANKIMAGRLSVNEIEFKNLINKMDLESIVSTMDQSTRNLVLRLYYTDCNIKQAAKAEGIPVDEAAEKIAKLKDNKELVQFLRD